MAQLDALCLTILGLFAVYGFFKGFFTQVMSLLALLLAYIGAPWFAPGVEHFIAGFIKLPEMIASRAAWIIAGLGIFLALQLLSKLIHNHVINSLAITKYTNRFLGFFVGIAKGLCIVYLLYILISWHPEAKSIYANTQIMTWIEYSPLKNNFAKPSLSENQKKSIEEKIAKNKKTVEKKVTEHVQSELANQSLDKLLEGLD
ncbi:MAG TPA: CvpA family protein [Oligoflexia bacterium]|mgnify:CR=1 FL=1|nr:CvpA family protein [Oligoflexia bacterium]HMR24779.1 CvpA family protein [Oligoflexia bacterium]